MKTFVLAVCFVVLVPQAGAQTASDGEDIVMLRDSEERERIRRTRATEQAAFAEQEASCYARFAVNDCLARVRGRKREVLGDLRRQEISLNDAQRKRRGAEQLLRSDERVPKTQ